MILPFATGYNTHPETYKLSAAAVNLGRSWLSASAIDEIFPPLMNHQNETDWHQTEST